MTASDTYRTIVKPSQGIFRDRGSKFLAFAYPVRSREEIKTILGELKKQYHDARHHCYAYRLGAAKKEYRVNDDGEPSHSAGKPILGQIHAHGLSNVLVVVVRYFGGTLLGVGGLIRAYRSAAASALENAAIVTEYETELIEIRFPYARTGEIMRILEEAKIRIRSEDYTDTCRLEALVRISRTGKVLERINKLPDASGKRKQGTLPQ